MILKVTAATFCPLTEIPGKETTKSIGEGILSYKYKSPEERNKNKTSKVEER
ncbi:MAG: hypothetical protein N2749_06435 [Clostridia bacterium]|nr:hypothetical protein [Clostridia bacterium]